MPTLEGGVEGPAAVVAVSLTGLTNVSTPHSVLGPDAVGLLCAQLVRSSVEAHDGVVARSDGHGIHAVFEDPRAALEAGAGIQEATRGDPLGTGTAVLARVGVSMGPVVIDDGDIHGGAVVEAVRLCAAAEVGLILCTEAVRRAVSVGRFRFAPSPALVGSGIANPLGSYAVEWDAGPASVDDRNAVTECDFAVLGPLLARSRDGPAKLGGLKEQTLLALLLAQVNQEVSAASLIEGIWGEQPPRTAAKTLQGYVLRLRQALEPGRTKGAPPTTLLTTGAGYLLRVEPSRLDVARFEQLLGKAARERGAGDWAGAGASLRTALGLWRGNPYAQYLDAAPCVLEAERLTGLYQQAREDLVEADLESGSAADVIPELERLVRENPFRERLWGQLMVALYRRGRQTDALRTFQRARDALVEEMGIEPGPELRRLEAAILAQDASLSTPAHTVAAATRQPRLPRRLEVIGPSFVGRAKELACLSEAWRDAAAGRGGLVAVVGPDGAGKTRLIAELARTADSHGSVVCFGRCSDEDGTARTVIAQLLEDGGLTPSDVADRRGDLVGPGPAAALARFLAGWATDTPVLAVIDELHRGDASAVALVAELGRACEQMPVLVAMTTAGDAPSPARQIHLGGLSIDEIVALGALYSPADWCVADAAQVFRDTGGLPLAVHERVSEMARARGEARLIKVTEQADITRSGLAAAQAGIAEQVIDLQGVEARRRAHLRVVEPANETPDVAPPCPYKGLARFEAEDAQNFFGRERLVATLTARLVGADLLVVTGPSGCGKSSVIRAGLLPALAAEVLPGSRSWQVITLHPGRHPLMELQRRLGGGYDSVSRRIIFIDQFEELFSACEDRREREDYVAALLALLPADPPTIVLLAIRSDQLGHFAEYPDLAERMAGNDVLVGPMSHDQLRMAVEGPALQNGLEIETGLASTIVDDVAGRPGALPLLSTALLETWERRRGRMLTLAGYNAAGGVEGAVARLAESTYARLDSSQQRAARRILLHLADVTPGRSPDLRRGVPLTQIVAADDADAAVALDALVGRRLLTVGHGTVEVTHEALLREWPRLRDWLEADVEGRRLHQRFTAQATAWEESGHDRSELLRGPRLSAALDWAETHREDLNARESTFLERSRAEAVRETTEARRQAEQQVRVNKRLRRRLALVGLVAAVAVAAGVLAVGQSRRATAAARRADGLRLATDSAALPADQLERALLIARQAWQLDDSTDTRSALLTALQRSPRLARFLPGLSAGVDAADASRDGKTVAVVSSDHTVHLFDPRTGLQLSSFATGQSGQTAGVVLSPDGQTVVTLGGDATVKLWDRKGRSLGPPLGAGDQTSLPGGLKGAYVRQAAFSPDGRALVTLDDAGHVLLWDVVAERAVAELPEVNLPLINKYDIVFSPDGTQVAVAGAPSVVVDTRTLRQVFARPAATPPGPDTSVAFSADGRMLATANASEVEIWDVAAGREARPALTAGANVNQIQFSPDGHLLATGLVNGTTQLWDTSTFAPDGSPLVGQQGVISQTAFVPFGSLLVTATNASVAVWDTALVRPLGSAIFPGDGAAITGVAYSPDGRWAAASSSLGPVELWHVTGGQPTGQPVLLSIDGPDTVTAVAFRPDGRRLVVGRSDGSIVSFDPATPEKPGRSVRVAGGGVTALAFAPGGAILAIGAEDGTIALVNPANGSVRKVINSHPGGPVGGLAFSPDGSKLASSGADGRLIVDDVRDSGSTVLAVRTPETMNGVAYRPDGHAVAVADSGGLATVAQAPAGVRSAVLSPGGGAVEAVAFSPHGRLFATAAQDGTVRLWDPDTQQPVGTPLAGPVPGLRVIAFSPQGREMVTGGRDGTIVFWSADPAAWAARLCDVVGRQLTKQEWAQLLPTRGYHPACTTRDGSKS